MEKDIVAAENNEELEKAKRIAEGISNLIKDIDLDENDINEELFNSFSNYFNQIDGIENLVYKELGNLLNAGNKPESDFANSPKEEIHVYKSRNKNFLILLAEFIARNKHINEKFFTELGLGIDFDKNILSHNIYSESSLGNFLGTDEYTRTKTNDILWIYCNLNELCKEVENAKANEIQNSSNEKQYFNFAKKLQPFTLINLGNLKISFYDLIFGKLIYDNKFCDFAIFFKKVQEGNINFSDNETEKSFNDISNGLHESWILKNLNNIFGKVAEIHSFAQKKLGIDANKFTNDFFRNLSYEKMYNLDINPLLREFNRWSVSRIIRDNNELSAEELIALSKFSQKSWPWNRNKNLQRLLLNDDKGESGLKKVTYVADNLPKNQVDDFYKWLYENRDSVITKNGLADDFWDRAQNAGFLSREQEELLQLVPSEKQDEFRKLFQNENFRKVCQTPQDAKKLLNVMEVCSLNPIEYINECLKNKAQIEDIKIAVDTFDMNKIFEIYPALHDINKDEQKIYEFLFLNNWIIFVRELNKINIGEDKNKLLQYPQIACNLLYGVKEQLIDELSDENSARVIIKNSDKLFSKECIEYYRESMPDGYVGFDVIQENALKYLETEDAVGVTVAFQILAGAKISEKDLCDNLFLLKPEIVAKFILIVEEKNDLDSLIKIDSFLNKPALKKIRNEVTKIIVNEAFENENDKVQQFYEKMPQTFTFYIYSKKSVLELDEFFQVGLDINKIAPEDFIAMESLINNVNDKDSWRKKFVEFSNMDGYKKDFVYQIKNFVEGLNKGLNEGSTEKEIYDFLNSSLSTLKEAIVLNISFISEILLSVIEAEKLATVCIQLGTLMKKNFSYNFARELMGCLAANSKVAEELIADENKPKLDEIFCETEERA